MGRHFQGTPLLRLLSALWHKREGNRWTVHGHDQDGRSTSLVVGVCEDGITLTPKRAGPIVLAPLQAGRLRAGVRDAIVAMDQPGQAVRQIPPPPAPSPRPWPPSPHPRVSVTLAPDGEPPTKPKFRAPDFVHRPSSNDTQGRDGNQTAPAWPDRDADDPRLAA